MKKFLFQNEFVYEFFINANELKFPSGDIVSVTDTLTAAGVNPSMIVFTSIDGTKNNDVYRASHEDIDLKGGNDVVFTDAGYDDIELFSEDYEENEQLFIMDYSIGNDRIEIKDDSISEENWMEFSFV